MTRHDPEAKVVRHIWENESFRSEFLADPTASRSKYLQVAPASLPKIVVHEESEGLWHIVLPAKAASAGGLSDGDLERVAGGRTTIRAMTTSVPLTAASVSLAVAGTAESVVVSIMADSW
jgi:hypothetical protein